MAGQPIDRVKWVHRDNLHGNNYNPNAMAPPELELLKISIMEDGWTQPIVALKDGTIVDGYHRWTVSADKRIERLTGGMVPVVYISPANRASQQMATIRHNRAKGSHGVLKMADIIQGMIKQGVSMQEICTRLQMEREEVVRLAARMGVPRTAIVHNTDWSPSWEPD